MVIMKTNQTPQLMQMDQFKEPRQMRQISINGLMQNGLGNIEFWPPVVDVSGTIQARINTFSGPEMLS